MTAIGRWCATPAGSCPDVEPAAAEAGGAETPAAVSCFKVSAAEGCRCMPAAGCAAAAHELNLNQTYRNHEPTTPDRKLGMYAVGCKSKWTSYPCGQRIQVEARLGGAVIVITALAFS